MRSLTRWLNAGLIAFLILGFLPALPYLAPAAEAAPPADRPLVISEFRLRGPNGANDEFIEITNIGSGTHTVASTSGNGYGLAASNGVIRATIPNGTVIPPGGHYLIVNSVGYSLASYAAGNGTTATGDATYTTDIPDNAGIALFSTNVAANLTTATRIDAVGSTSEANSLYREGSGYPALTPFSIDSAFGRNECGNTASSTTQSAQFTPCAAPGRLQDTENNAVDFVFVDTNGTSAGAGQRLGAPGPQNLSAPLNGCTTGASGLPIAPLDPTVGLFAAPNFVRDFTSDPANNSTFGTIEIRRRVTNNTGGSITRLRFRVTDIATFPAGSGIADLRPRTSTAIVATTSGGNVTVQGTSLEQSPSQPNGGGFNSSLSVGALTLATPLPAGGTIDVRFLFGLQQTGDFKLSLQAETLPSFACAETRLVGQTEDARAFRLTATNGTPQSAAVGAAFAAPLRVAVTGANNSPRPNAAVLFTAPGNGAGGTFAGGGTAVTVVTDANGAAIAPAFTANGTAGTYSIVARVLNSGGANDVAHATATFALANTAIAVPSPTPSPTPTPSPSAPAPVAAAESYSTPEGVALTVAAPGVLGNDSGAGLTAAIVANPINGTLILGADGAFSYTPHAGFSGTDQFTYRAVAGAAQSAPATVTIRVARAASGTSAALTTGVEGQGAIGANPAGGSHPIGTVVTLTPQPTGGSLFIGWVVDGTPAGWANPPTITLDRDHTVVARFATATTFPDLNGGDPAYAPVRELAARGIVRGYEDGRFGPNDPVLRAQAAALVVRALGWGGENWGNPFTDQGSIDDELWRNVGILSHYGVARGFGDGTYAPTETVTRAQLLSLVTRAMVARGYWAMQPDDPGRFATVGASHRQDLITFRHYVGGFPDLTESSPATAWFDPASRGWTARAIWAALDQYQRVDRVP